MADIERVLANGGWAIIGVVVGASLTYLFGSLNRRHQEAREDKTRWHTIRFDTYARLAGAVTAAVSYGEPNEVLMREVHASLNLAWGTSRLLGARDVQNAIDSLSVVFDAQMARGKDETNLDAILDALHRFLLAAHRDIGSP